MRVLPSLRANDGPDVTMSNRYHIPVVITTTNEMERAEAIDYVESVVANLEETENVYRTFVEKNGFDEAEAEQLLDMLDSVETWEVGAAIEAIEHLSEETEE